VGWNKNDNRSRWGIIKTPLEVHRQNDHEDDDDGQQEVERKENTLA